VQVLEPFGWVADSPVGKCSVDEIEYNSFTASVFYPEDGFFDEEEETVDVGVREYVPLQTLSVSNEQPTRVEFFPEQAKVALRAFGYVRISSIYLSLTYLYFKIHHKSQYTMRVIMR